MLRILWPVLVAGLVGPATASAQGRVMVAPIDGTVDSHPDLGAKLTDALTAAAKEAKVKHAKGAIGLDELALMSGCSIDDQSCRKTLLGTLQAGSIIAGSVAEGGAGVQVTLVHIDGDAKINTQTHDLTGDTTDELVTSFEPIAAAVFGVEGQAPPGGTDPGGTDPGGTDPGATDPGTTDPGTTDPGSTDPGGAGSGNQTVDPFAGGNTTGPTGPTDSGSRRRLLAWGLVGAGAALTAGGLVTLVLAGNVQNDIDEAPTSTAAELDALEELEDKGRFRYRLSYALLGTGAVSLAAGITMVLLQRGERRRTAAVVKTDGGYAAVIGGTF